MNASFALFCNDRFYRAFNERDMNAMEQLWARRAPITCIHPGWPALFGREEVIDSWRRILGNAQAPRIRCYGARALSLEAYAAVVCYEALGSGVLVAINGFVMEDGEARLISHQASPCQSPPDNDDQEVTWQ